MVNTSQLLHMLKILADVMFVKSQQNRKSQIQFLVNISGYMISYLL